MSLAVQPTGPADLRDAEWLDEQVADLGRGIEAARAIWSNWFDGRQVGRLHPGLTPGDYIASLGMRLTLPEALAAMPDASTRQVAAAAGVGVMTVHDARVRNRTPDDSPTVTGGDGKSYPRRTVVAEIIDEGEPIDLDDIPPSAVEESARVWLGDIRKYLTGAANVPPPPQTDPVFYRRLRRGLVPALLATLDALARDE